jgi:hypothetical protein
VPGTDPASRSAPFTDLTDGSSPRAGSRARLRPKVVFCAAVDRNGYLPTHNRKFSQPQGKRPGLERRACRNRRIFADRVGLKAGRSTAPFLLQVYRRDMGGGEFRMMKDLISRIALSCSISHSSVRAACPRGPADPDRRQQLARVALRQRHQPGLPFQIGDAEARQAGLRGADQSPAPRIADPPRRCGKPSSVSRSSFSRARAASPSGGS